MKKILLCVIVILISACSLSTDPENNANNNTQKIPIPGAVTVTVASLSSITVSWNPVLDAATYSVFRSQSGEVDSFSRVKVTREASWTDTGLTAGTTYYYQVSAALNNAGEGERSTVVSACPMLPPAPGNVTAEVLSANGIVITWDASPSADTYTIYRKDNAGDDYRVLQTELTVLTYTDSSVAMGNEYYYKVAGVNQFGEGALSLPVSGAIGILTTPQNVRSETISAGSIVIIWDMVPSAASYTIYRANSAAGEYIILSAAPITGLSYTDNSVTVNNEYYYKVMAVNKYGESALSSYTSSATTLPPVPSGGGNRRGFVRKSNRCLMECRCGSINV